MQDNIYSYNTLYYIVPYIMKQKDETLKIATQMRKGVLEYAILSIVGKGEAYASDILEILKKSNLIVVE